VLFRSVLAEDGGLAQEIQHGRVAAVERGEAANDQIALWHCLQAVNPERVGMLPSTFWTHGQLAGQLYPCELSAAQVPLGIFVHHCNYAVGVAAKVALGDQVEDLVYGKGNAHPSSEPFYIPFRK
jgi:hypothetical protein